MDHVRWNCLQLAALTLKKPEGHETVIEAAKAFLEFVQLAEEGTGIPHDAANQHRAHPTIQ